MNLIDRLGHGLRLTILKIVTGGGKSFERRAWNLARQALRTGAQRRAGIGLALQDRHWSDERAFSR